LRECAKDQDEYVARELQSQSRIEQGHGKQRHEKKHDTIRRGFDENWNRNRQYTWGICTPDSKTDDEGAAYDDQANQCGDEENVTF
jgi:hypothetical protein